MPPRGDACVCVSDTCGHMCVRLRVICWLSTYYGFYGNPLSAWTLYTGKTLHFSPYGTIFISFLFGGDVAQRNTSDRVIKSRSSDVTYSRGYVAAFD